MSKRAKFLVITLITFAVCGALWLLIKDTNVAILNPQGTVAEKQRNILVFTVGLSLLVILPVFTMLFLFTWKFREGNKKAKYRPDWDHNNKLEAIWWGIPCAIILLLAVITWNSSHDLDPYRPLVHDKKPITVQVVALQWRWLFIYPEYDIASVNLVQFPKDTPINFEISADAPMNSFWIPNLGGQVYAMTGMSTKLHLIAEKTGDYPGASANISGEGFASMRFTARATTQAEFDSWVSDVKRSSPDLNLSSYDELAKPSITKDPHFFALKEPDLYTIIMMRYMAHDDNHTDHPEHEPAAAEVGSGEADHTHHQNQHSHGSTH